jgi:serine/threonine protein kinase
VAIKVIKVENVDEDLDREIELLTKLKSPFIVSFVESLAVDNDIWVYSNSSFRLTMKLCLEDHNGVLRRWIVEGCYLIAQTAPD